MGQLGQVGPGGSCGPPPTPPPTLRIQPARHAKLIHAPFAGIAKYDPMARSSTLEQGSHTLPPTTKAPSYRSTHTLAFATNAELEGQVTPAAMGAHAAAVMMAQMGKVRDADQRRRRMGGWGTWWSPSLEMGKLGNNDDPSQHTYGPYQTGVDGGRAVHETEGKRDVALMCTQIAGESSGRANAIPLKVAPPQRVSAPFALKYSCCAKRASLFLWVHSLRVTEHRTCDVAHAGY